MGRGRPPRGEGRVCARASSKKKAHVCMLGREGKEGRQKAYKVSHVGGRGVRGREGGWG